MTRTAAASSAKQKKAGVLFHRCVLEFAGARSVARAPFVAAQGRSTPAVAQPRRAIVVDDVNEVWGAVEFRATTAPVRSVGDVLRRVERALRVLAVRRQILRRAANAVRDEDVASSVAAQYINFHLTRSPVPAPALVDGFFDAGPWPSSYAPAEGVLGEGSMAFVVAARSVHTGALCALKFLGARRDGRSTPQSRLGALEEVRVHRAVTALRSRHLLPLLSAHDGALSAGAGHAVIATPVARRGDLYERIVGLNGLPEERALRMLRQVLQALAVLHSGGFVHRDVKPDNVFLLSCEETDGHDDFVLGDFGFTIEMSSLSTLKSTWRTTPLYAAPELALLASAHGGAAATSTARDFSEKSDVFAAGVTFYSALTATDMTAKGPDHALLEARKVSAKSQALLRLLLAENPDERPTAATALHEKSATGDEQSIETDAE